MDTSCSISDVVSDTTQSKSSTIIELPPLETTGLSVNRDELVADRVIGRGKVMKNLLYMLISVLFYDH